MYNGKEFEDGSVHRYGCNECTCTAGVVSCSQVPCDCSVRSDSTCCPHCDPANSCVHQELPHVVFTSGERWIYQCQTCECLVSFIIDSTMQII